MRHEQSRRELEWSSSHKTQILVLINNNSGSGDGSCIPVGPWTPDQPVILIPRFHKVNSNQANRNLAVTVPYC
jgi:hypothetical protein